MHLYAFIASYYIVFNFQSFKNTRDHPRTPPWMVTCNANLNPYSLVYKDVYERDVVRPRNYCS
jgi:hypothetical protein